LEGNGGEDFGKQRKEQVEEMDDFERGRLSS